MHNQQVEQHRVVLYITTRMRQLVILQAILQATMHSQQAEQHRVVQFTIQAQSVLLQIPIIQCSWITRLLPVLRPPTTISSTQELLTLTQKAVNPLTLAVVSKVLAQLISTMATTVLQKAGIMYSITP